MTSVITQPCAADYSRKVMARIIRRAPEVTQPLRHGFQFAFLLLNLWIGARFYFFVRYCETQGRTAYVPRPPGVEGWLPIAGLMNLKYALLTRTFPEVHAAGFFLFVAFLGISIAFRKAFCSWLCPIGTLSEWLWQGGSEMFGRTWDAPRWLDIPLRSLKYLILGFFGYAIANMSVEEIAGFLASPYGMIADVKLLNFFRTMGSAAALMVLVLLVGSVFVKNPWCRYLCPYGALLGLAALVSPARIRRDPVSCIDCDKCAKACPSLIPVARLLTVKTPECTACLECVTACPVAGALDLAPVASRRRVPGWALAAGVACLFIATVAFAKATHRWHDTTPDEVYLQLIPSANAFSH